MRVLLIEDDASVAFSTELLLSAEGFKVYATDLGEDGLELAKLYDFDLVILDLSLPDMHGYEVLKGIRRAQKPVPVLVLSGTGEMETKLHALRNGADDYLTKPYHREELVARIRAVIRRSNGHCESIIRTGELSLDLGTKAVEVDGQRVHLTAKEYAVLELLSLRKGTPVTKEMFLNHLYGYDDEPNIKIIDVLICKLRKKLSAACGDDYIETMWAQGYVLRDPEPGAQPLRLAA